MKISELEAQIAQIKGMLKQNGKTDEQIANTSIHGYLSGFEARWNPVSGFRIFAKFDEGLRESMNRNQQLQNQYNPR
jgi:hypothetical protein